MAVTINGTTGVTTNNSVYTDASGNTGIGTTSPGVYKLNVNYDNNGNQAIVQGSANNIDLAIQNNQTASYNWRFVVGGTTGLYSTNKFGLLDNTNTGRLVLDTSGYITNFVSTNGAGLVQGQQYYRLNTAVAGANATGAQSIFGVGVTLVGSTVYEFELVVAMSHTAGATSHTVALGFGGTATVNNIAYDVTSHTDSAVFSSTGQTVTASFIQTASSSVITGAATTPFRSYVFILKGTVSINAGGTFIPQYTLSAAPGGAYTTAIGSYIKISALSASGANTSIGTWA
jgi:hypothetical protein